MRPKFYATEAALSLAVWTYNLVKLFARQLGQLETATITTLRQRLFHRAGIISRSQTRPPSSSPSHPLLSLQPHRYG